MTVNNPVNVELYQIFLYQIFFQRGKLDVVADDGREIYVTLGEGAVFGEVRCCSCCRCCSC